MHHAHIDKFAYQDSPIHRLDSRVKFVVVLVFTAVVVSLPRTSLSILACYAVGPFAILVLAGIPLRFTFKQILLVSPFVVVLALSCPLYDRTPITVAFGPFSRHLTVGWMRGLTILGKFIVTMLALIALVSTTRFNDLLTGLQRLGLPRVKPPAAVQAAYSKLAKAYLSRQDNANAQYAAGLIYYGLAIKKDSSGVKSAPEILNSASSDTKILSSSRWVTTSPEDTRFPKAFRLQSVWVLSLLCSITPHGSSRI